MLSYQFSAMKLSSCIKFYRFSSIELLCWLIWLENLYFHLVFLNLDYLTELKVFMELFLLFVFISFSFKFSFSNFCFDLFFFDCSINYLLFTFCSFFFFFLVNPPIFFFLHFLLLIFMYINKMLLLNEIKVIFSQI